MLPGSIVGFLAGNLDYSDFISNFVSKINCNISVLCGYGEILCEFKKSRCGHRTERYGRNGNDREKIHSNCAKKSFYREETKNNREGKVCPGAIRFDFGAIRFDFGAIRFRLGAIKKGPFAIICSQGGAVGCCWLTVGYSDSIVLCK